MVGSLGSGSAADVFRVRDVRSGVLRAAKVFKPENAANPKVLARFEDEFRILRTLHHPHLPEVYDYGWTDDGGRFLVMEFVDGVALDQYFRENPDDIWAILYELCETLTFVHDHKLLHQDIKPSNILVKRTTAYGPELPLVKLIDFGLIYKRDAAAAVELVGTPEYMAPEVARGDASLTRAVDYYSLGATLFELLVGRPPFVGAPRDVLRAHLDREPVIENESLEWAELYPHVRALLTKDRHARLEAFEEFRRAVVSRLTGGIDELDRAYAVAREQSPAREKLPAEAEAWLADVVTPPSEGESKRDAAIEIVGRAGSVRNQLVDTLCAESAIRGGHILRLGPSAGPALRESDRKQGQVERFNRAIQRVEALRPKSVVMVLNGIELLSDDEAGFVRYVVTMQALKPDAGTRYLFLIARDVGGADHPLDSYLPRDRIPFVLPVDRLTRDAGDVYQVSALAKAALDTALSDSQRTMLAYVGSHPGPVPREWVRGFSSLAATEFSEEIDRLVTRHLVYPVAVGPIEALVASDVARSVGPSIVSTKTVAAIHRDLATRLEREGIAGDRGYPALELVAYHYEAVGDARNGLIARIRALKSAFRAKSLSDVERIAQSALTELAKAPILSTGTRHYFVKQWVRALWARNQHANAKAVIDEHIVHRREGIPHSLLPKYVRGILDTEAPRSALTFVNGIDMSSLPVRTRRQVVLEKVLVLNQNGRYKESLGGVDSLERAQGLSVKDRHRLAIYRAMNLSQLGSPHEAERVLATAATVARKDACIDEFVLMSIMRAQERTMTGKPRDALRVISQTLRIAHRHELYLRLNALYRLAATAYVDLGEHRRALRAQENALAVASALGNSMLEGTSWMRLSEYGRASGHLGNALRYLEKADAMMPDSSYGLERAQRQLLALRIHSWLRSPDVARKIDDARWISETHGVNERGRYFMMIGNHAVDRGDVLGARGYYRKAEALLRRARIRDNLIAVSRARQRLAIVAELRSDRVILQRALISRELRSTDSKNGQLERNLALLELAYHDRLAWGKLKLLCDGCLRLADDSAEAPIRLEVLALVFRAYARHGKVQEATVVISRLWQVLKSVTSNLEERYIPGLMERLDVAQLANEFDILQKRNKAGVATSLVEEPSAAVD